MPKSILFATIVLLAGLGIVASMMAIRTQRDVTRMGEERKQLMMELERLRSREIALEEFEVELQEALAAKASAEEQVEILETNILILREKVSRLESELASASSDPAGSGGGGGEGETSQLLKEELDETRLQFEQAKAELDILRETFLSVEFETRERAESFAMELLRKGQWSDAANAFGRVMLYKDGTGSLTNEAAFLHRGLALSMGGDWTNAYLAMRAAVKLDPRIAGSGVNFLSAVPDRAILTAAIEKLEGATRQQTKNTNLRMLQGMLYQYTGRRADAAGVFNEILEIDPNHDTAGIMLGR